MFLSLQESRDSFKKMQYTKNVTSVWIISCGLEKNGWRPTDYLSVILPPGYFHESLPQGLPALLLKLVSESRVWGVALEAELNEGEGFFL